jgi:hypothetical protein
LKSEKVAYAETNDSDVEKELNDEIDKSLDELMNNDLEDFFNSLESSVKSSFGATFRDFVENILNGGTFDFSLFTAMIGEAVKKNIVAIISSLVSIIMLSILYGLAKKPLLRFF